jgi:hypothetical protein
MAEETKFKSPFWDRGGGVFEGQIAEKSARLMAGAKARSNLCAMSLNVLHGLRQVRQTRLGVAI